MTTELMFYILTITTTTNLTYLTVFDTSVLFGGRYIHEAFPTILNGISRYRILDIGYWISDIGYRILHIGYWISVIGYYRWIDVHDHKPR